MIDLLKYQVHLDLNVFGQQKTWFYHCSLGPVEISGPESKHQKGVKMNQRQNFPEKCIFLMDWLFSCEAGQSLRFIEQTIEEAARK